MFAVFEVRPRIFSYTMNLAAGVDIEHDRKVNHKNNTSKAKANHENYPLLGILNSYHLFSSIVLLVPPSCEESHFYIYKRPVRIQLQLLYNRVQDVLHCSLLDRLVSCAGEKHSCTESCTCIINYCATYSFTSRYSFLELKSIPRSPGPQFLHCILVILLFCSRSNIKRRFLSLQIFCSSHDNVHFTSRTR